MVPQVFIARMNDLEQVVKVDSDVTGNENRRDAISRAIQSEQCLILIDGETLGGFLLYHTHFFDCAFISLIIVSPLTRRQGYARHLLEYFMKVSPTSKVFSSTNQSNEPMRRVFASAGFIESGVIENLDEGDPEIVYFKER
ncbi:acetyltransferase [Bacillus coahuilensis m2-6]|uniref:GNAT family N-acetyltransferase n=1 Tax=Bacillus coahuilensis TaxID=408580 RepID=UPI0007504FD1|nr:GNAT family N-acetyltransferase [Bacillus coahuilensis]KUP07455.1 acetyltransferase [Bacillus coahuilensis m2-6]